MFNNNELVEPSREELLDYIEELEVKADKLAEAISKAMDETPIHEYCFDILEEALKDYYGE
jgi:2-phospho-L-lactate guanylyltransferase (CobY/MobA/RfbA family)